MFLSIAIPSNNKKKYLFEAIKSILNDNYKNNNFEICISDNSKDNKSDEINSFFKNNKIKYHLSDCFKMVENINNVVNLSVGEYVWLFGDDDLLIDGQYKKPQLLYTDAKQKVKFERLLKLKKDLLPKLKNTQSDPTLR